MKVGPEKFHIEWPFQIVDGVPYPIAGGPMSTAEGPRKWEVEKDAIDEAYADHIKKLFDVYYLGATFGGDKEALAKFKGAVEALRRARVHALSIFSDHGL